MDASKLLAYAVGCNPDTDPFDDWWHLPAASWVATIRRVFDPKDGLFTRLLHGGRSRAVRHRHAPVLGRGPPAEAATAAALAAPARGLLFRTAAIAAHARSSPAAKARPAATAPACHRRRPHASTSPRLHLLPVSLRTANVFVLAHHHRPVQAAKFALAVTLSTAT
jgi:hypothetical protein